MNMVTVMVAHLQIVANNWILLYENPRFMCSK